MDDTTDHAKDTPRWGLARLRRAFLDYFAEAGHAVVPSSPLVPENDPSLLFTNAGMVQFKNVFLGLERRPYSRACSAQRCLRAGGKHNDLDNVGYTARHHTFFEMLGNFSFGDYFKREAIQLAWRFLTEVLELPPQRLWVTVYAEDDEAARIWLDEIGIDPARFTRIGDKPGGRRYESDNFWSMGDTGPCGPCSEIFYDHGPDIPGGPPGTPEEDGDRFVEIWNLVFMQYERAPDGSMSPLPKPSVDTGMGLERLAAVMQGVHSNYDIDLFRRLMDAAAASVGVTNQGQAALKVIADHIRACAFLITDGVLPGNEGRGYVLRRIIRRAVRHGFELGQKQPFFHRLVAPLVAEMGEAYPELAAARERVEQTLLQEEQRFAETIEQGMGLLEQAIAELSGDTLPGELVFRLYDTYGFPVDLTADIAQARGLSVDMDGFEREMARQRQRAREASRFQGEHLQGVEIDGQSEFTGYHRLQDQGRVIGLFHDGRAVEALEAGQDGVIVLDRTPFYAESGGQVGDAGWIDAPEGRFEVHDTQKRGGLILHIGRQMEGHTALGEEVTAKVHESARRDTARNHSATHLLHAALRHYLGDHVQQKGSLVEAQRLRFDFSHPQPLTREQILEIERLVNEEIRANHPVEARLMALDEALKSGAMALFGEKYGDEVRVLSMGEFSVELCGGTHVNRTGDIGLFKILSEGGVAAGVRRIEATSGRHAVEWLQALEDQALCIAERLNAPLDELADKVERLQRHERALEKELQRLKAKLASQAGSDLAAQAQEIAGVHVLAARLDGVDAKGLRETLDRLKNKLRPAAIVLATVEDGKVRLVAGVSKDLTDRLKAGELVNHVAAQVGGRGGGRPDMAQAGGSDPQALPRALDSVPGWVAERLEGG